MTVNIRSHISKMRNCIRESHTKMNKIDDALRRENKYSERASELIEQNRAKLSQMSESLRDFERELKL